MYWSGERLGEGCGGVWRSVEVCGGVWRSVEGCGVWHERVEERMGSYVVYIPELWYISKCVPSLTFDEAT